MNTHFYPLTVRDTRLEIGGRAKSVIFDLTPDQRTVFKWRPGQHLSLRFDLDGEQYRRSYSISSSPYSDAALRITVKGIEDGRISNHIVERVVPGDVIDVMPPFGNFTLDCADNARRTYYFFAAGSGITPIYSMLSAVMSEEPNSVSYLVYGNNDVKHVLLNDEINALWQTHQKRMLVNHIFSNPGLWSGTDAWRSGRIDAVAVEAMIRENPPYAQDTQYYVCGPGAMNNAVKEALMHLDVPASRIHMESYGGAAALDDTVTGVAANATVTLNDKTHLVPVAVGQSLLDAMQSAKLNPPYSCQSGVCGACSAKLTAGTVHMRSRMALSDDDVTQGRILTCQSVPTAKMLSVNFDY